MRSIAAFILIFLGVFTGTALAATAATPDSGSLLDLAKPVFEAVMHGQWWAAAALAVVLLCALAKKYMPDSWTAGIKGDIIGTAMAFVMAFAGAIATWALAPGAIMTMAVVLTAMKIGFAAVGGYTVIHKVVGWLAGWSKLPAWLAPILKLLAGLVGSNAVAKAEAAGDAAVAEHPSTGLAGDTKIVEVE
jgi:hypothetical protein